MQRREFITLLSGARRGRSRRMRSRLKGFQSSAFFIRDRRRPLQLVSRHVLPIESPTRFEFVLNLKTAGQLGLHRATTCSVTRRRGDRVAIQLLHRMSPLLAQSGHRLVRCTCLLLTQSGQSQPPMASFEIGNGPF